MSLTPQFEWAQDSSRIFLKIKVPFIDKTSIKMNIQNLDKNNLKTSKIEINFNTTKNVKYSLNILLFDELNILKFYYINLCTEILFLENLEIF
jgi:hypothetical protein